MSYRAISVYVGREEFERLECEAALRGDSVSRCARECLMEYFSLKDEFIPLKGDKEEKGGDRLIQALLARTEERIASSIDVQAEKTEGLRLNLKILEIMLEKFVFLYLLHTDEILEDKQDKVFDGASRRFGKWVNAYTTELEQVIKLDTTKTKKAKNDNVMQDASS